MLVRLAPFTALLLILLTSACANRLSATQHVEPNADGARPNILLIVADDLGYADLGAFGSTIRTPNIDLLADRGIRFTQFHTGPMCAPTRSMLLSGNNNHVAGMARQSPWGMPKDHLPGYEGHLSDRIAPLPRLLRDGGYHTYMAGKWHLGTAKEESPRAVGFERSFGLVDGAGNHWDDVGFFDGGSTFREDGEETAWPEDGYSTAVYTNKLIGFIESGRQDGKPFFAFAAYTSPHWPLQVPAEELDRYSGAYDHGYDVQRQENFENLKGAGIIPVDSALPPRFEDIAPWASLSADDKRREARKMELYAAMLENLDGHIGRLIEYLRSSGQIDNTLIVFMSDNGAAAEDFYHHDSYGGWIRERYDNSFGNMGNPDSFVSYGPQWAEAGSAPFKRHKGYTSEGGIVAPMIIAGAGVTVGEPINRSYLTVMDLAPTFLQVADVGYPENDSIQPMRGESLLGLLSGHRNTVHDEDYVTTLYHGGRAYLRRGEWKITQNQTPFDESQFALYNLSTDPGESLDLRDQQSGIYEELLELWRAQRLELGIVLPQDL